MSEHGAAPAELLVLLQSSLERPRAQSRASSPPCMFLMSRCSMTSGAGARSSRLRLYRLTAGVRPCGEVLMSTWPEPALYSCGRGLLYSPCPTCCTYLCHIASLGFTHSVVYRCVRNSVSRRICRLKGAPPLVGILPRSLSDRKRPIDPGKDSPFAVQRQRQRRPTPALAKTQKECVAR